MLKINKILFLKTYIFVFVFLCVSFIALIFIGNKMFLHVPSLLRTIADTYKGEIEYNNLLVSRGSGDMSLLSSPSRARDVDRLELLADTIYIQSGSIEQVRRYYEDALTHERRKRIEDKLALLEGSSLSGAALSQGAKTDSIDTSQAKESYRSDVEDAKIRIKEDEGKRGSYLQKPNNTNILKDTIDFLDLGTERVDW